MSIDLQFLPIKSVVITRIDLYLQSRFYERLYQINNNLILLIRIYGELISRDVLTDIIFYSLQYMKIFF